MKCVQWDFKNIYWKIYIGSAVSCNRVCFIFFLLSWSWELIPPAGETYAPPSVRGKCYSSCESKVPEVSGEYDVPSLSPSTASLSTLNMGLKFWHSFLLLWLWSLTPDTPGCKSKPGKQKSFDNTDARPHGFRCEFSIPTEVLWCKESTIHVSSKSEGICFSVQFSMTREHTSEEDVRFSVTFFLSSPGVRLGQPLMLYILMKYSVSRHHHTTTQERLTTSSRVGLNYSEWLLFHLKLLGGITARSYQVIDMGLSSSADSITVFIIHNHLMQHVRKPHTVQTHMGRNVLAGIVWLCLNTY